MNTACAYLGVVVAVNMSGSPAPDAPGRADSLLLAMLGVIFILLSILARGFSHFGQPDDGLEDLQAEQSSRFDVVAVDLPIPAPQDRRVCPLMSVDVEDYFQTEAMSSVARSTNWDQFPL